MCVLSLVPPAALSLKASGRYLCRTLSFADTEFIVERSAVGTQVRGDWKRSGWGCRW
jgi:hypothetical protein